MTTVYDDLAMVYDAWSQSDPAADPAADFYLDVARKEKGTIVELGVGTGRIALQLACEGKDIIGLDRSQRMLKACRIKAMNLGVKDRIHLLESDIRKFDLESPASLIYLPFRTFGHLLTQEDRLDMLNSVSRNLRDGGCFIFDHYVFNDTWAKSIDRKPRLMCTISSENGEARYVYDIYIYKYEQQLMECRIAIEDVDASGVLIQKRYIHFDFSWVTPAQVHELIAECGLILEALYGDFDGQKWTEKSENQIWVLRKSK